MTVRELRQTYLAFFESKGHSTHPSGSLIPVDVTGRLDESLLFNGAGMVQFKPYFRGVAEPPNRRMVNAQKVMRTGDIESVGDTSHLTFFEMLGNFSFGDYFKVEAIAFSWEFLTSPAWLGLDPKRLTFTVFEEDDQAYDAWGAHVAGAGLTPEHRVFRLGEETNYWPAGAFNSGPPGPCGPNSEMFYWVPTDEPAPTGVYSKEDWLRDEEAGKWLEIWNDVFIQYEWQGAALPEGGYRKTGMPSLPFRSVDTGMGIERTAAVLGGHGNVYETDAFQPVFRKLEAISEGRLQYGREPRVDVAMRIVADHLRAACFCIADGILPSNTGRGYVLRRLIRRAVLKGQRVLGFEGPFAHQTLDGVSDALGDHYQELHFRRDVIIETLRNEESHFRRTLAQGSELLAERLAGVPTGGTLPGDVAFMLYDTYGFPLEVTQELCDERGVEVEQAGYQRAMAEAQERSRGASGMETVYGGVAVRFDFVVEDQSGPTPTLFVGYEHPGARTRIAGVLPVAGEDGRTTGELVIALDETPFYAESGGQVSDEGVIRGETFELRVREVHKQDGVFVHLVEPATGIDAAGLSQDEASALVQERLFNQFVDAVIDVPRRRDVQRNHTATHLLHAALRQVLGKHVTQAGSLVAPDHLRFDFTHGKAMTDEETARVERIVNERVLAAEPVLVYDGVPIDDARRMGAMALFGEKYADAVRVVQVGDMAPTEASFSRELCGGCHVRSTGEIGLFKITSEGSAASGVRRLVAVTGLGAYDWARGMERTVHEAAERLKANPKELVPAVERAIEQLREERRRRERLAAQGTVEPQADAIGPVELVVEVLRDAEPKDAQRVADRLVENSPRRVALVALIADGKLTFVAKLGPEAQAAGAHAGNLVREVAKVAGGGGGGRPDFATAGGKDPAKLEEALAAGRAALAAQVDA